MRDAAAEWARINAKLRITAQGPSISLIIGEPAGMTAGVPGKIDEQR